MCAASRIVFLDSGSRNVRCEKFYYVNIKFLCVVTMIFLESWPLNIDSMKLYFRKLKMMCVPHRGLLSWTRDPGMSAVRSFTTWIKNFYASWRWFFRTSGILASEHPWLIQWSCIFVNLKWCACGIEDCFLGLGIQECPLWEVLQHEYKIFMRRDHCFAGILASNLTIHWNCIFINWNWCARRIEDCFLGLRIQDCPFSNLGSFTFVTTWIIIFMRRDDCLAGILASKRWYNVFS